MKKPAQLVLAAIVSFVLVPAAASAAPASSGTVWLCRPGVTPDPCLSSETATVVQADGARRVVRTAPARRPPIDCFYVYPTVSAQQGDNADLHIDPEEIAVAQQQASRFSSVCRVYAPMYRQLTVAAILRAFGNPNARAIAYQGVQDAWRDYLAHDNHGRGVVFIGHSQGAAMLIALLRREVDPIPKVRKLMVSAVLLGGNVMVPAGADVGGSFQHLPTCHSARETGCVVAYSTFDQTPPANALFGIAGQGVSGAGSARGQQVACVNPGAPGGGTSALVPFFRTDPFPGPVGLGAPSQYKAATPWVELPKLYTATCKTVGNATWLQIDDVGGPGDARPRVRDVLGPTWGLHLFDVNLAAGNLVDLVRHEAAAYRG
jgi:Protein of unknown function (DUF3089)